MKLSHALVLIAALIVTPLLRASDLPAPLPEFMDQQQLAKWNANQTVAATTASANEPSTQFYTGKPYLADAGGYVYKYRTYNPEMSRWTSADPSGFPDGANDEFYAPVPTTQIDALGLSSVYWITEEDATNDPNPTIEALGDTIFSWAITNPGGEVVLRGMTTTDYNGAVENPDTVGYYTGAPANNPNAGVGSFGNTFSLDLASYNGSSWSLNGWVVSATFLQNVGGVNYTASNAWLNPIGASTSSSTIAGLSTLLYSTLLSEGAGYNGDLFYE